MKTMRGYWLLVCLWALMLYPLEEYVVEHFLLQTDTCCSCRLWRVIYGLLVAAVLTHWKVSNERLRFVVRSTSKNWAKEQHRILREAEQQIEASQPQDKSKTRGDGK
jgi:hypothetical protein